MLLDTDEMRRRKFGGSVAHGVVHVSIRSMIAAEKMHRRDIEKGTKHGANQHILTITRVDQHVWPVTAHHVQRAGQQPSSRL